MSGVKEYLFNFNALQYFGFIQLSIKKKVQKGIWISYGYNLILI
jgi:hypothetical protein